MATYFGAGNTTKHTPGSDVTAGDVIVEEDKVLVAKNDIASGVEGEVDTNGEFRWPKTAATAYTQGKPLYWDVADQEATEDADGGTNKKIGWVTKDALAADTEVYGYLANNV